MPYRLNDFDREILDAFADLPDLSNAGGAEHVLFEKFGNLTRLFQYLNALIDQEAAMAYNPVLVARLRRRREGRRGHLRAT